MPEFQAFPSREIQLTYLNGDDSFRDQVKAFSQASILIWPHGATMALTTFLPRVGALGMLHGRGCTASVAPATRQTRGCALGVAEGLALSLLSLRVCLGASAERGSILWLLCRVHRPLR